MADASKTQKDKIFYECCSRHAMASELLKCAECKKKYHFACVKTSNCQNYKDLTPEFLSSWQCPACNRPRPGIGNTNTPIRIPSSLFIASDSLDDLNRNVTNRNKRKKSRLSDSDTITPYDLTLEDVRQVVREELKALLDLFKSNIMSQVSPKLKEISDQITQVTNSISFMEQQHEELKKEVQLKIKSISVLETENKILQTTMKDLNARLSQLEQHSRANNIEIQCLPERKNEYLLSVVNRIANATKCNLKESDVRFCTRTSKLQKDSNRPRSVIVSFSSPRVRDEFLAATINFNKKAQHVGDKLNTSHAGVSGDIKPIYVAEHLSPTQKAARLKAKELNYRFVWVKRGMIYMRKSESTEYKFIRNMDTLNSIK
ncbi:uncharacterized protein LOC120624109 [Pararge aegeria]|uniref:uncharacterized protein LOC120624109 n=1 Tax=Pararge aegeria TaxID=116150 RepID=UPI0019D23A8C|nr:uncharacterized protein LOC120624109 [Pararge aegeria]